MFNYLDEYKKEYEHFQNLKAQYQSGKINPQMLIELGDYCLDWFLEDLPEGDWAKGIFYFKQIKYFNPSGEDLLKAVVKLYDHHFTLQLIHTYTKYALRLGNKKALFYLGHFHSLGWGTKKSEKRALKYYRRGAKLGEINCQIKWAQHLMRYFPSQAFRLAQSISEKIKKEETEIILAYCYFHGIGTKQDLNLAKKHLFHYYELDEDISHEYFKELCLAFKKEFEEQFQVKINSNGHSLELVGL